MASIEGAGLVGRRPLERADVQLVDHELVVGRDGEGVALPVEGGVVNDAVAGRVRHLARVRIDAREALVVVANLKAILVAEACGRDVEVEAAVALGLENVGIGGPVVERADHGDSSRVRRPHAKRRTAGVRDRAHPCMNL